MVPRLAVSLMTRRDDSVLNRVSISSRCDKFACGLERRKRYFPTYLSGTVEAPEFGNAAGGWGMQEREKRERGRRHTGEKRAEVSSSYLRGGKRERDEEGREAFLTFLNKLVEVIFKQAVGSLVRFLEICSLTVLTDWQQIDHYQDASIDHDSSLDQNP